jgi:hypothetical protein
VLPGCPASSGPCIATSHGYGVLPPASTLPPAATSTPTRTPTPTPTATDTPSSGITGRATRNGVPASGLNLELRRCDASSCTTAATSATRGDGRYTFAGAPSLGAGESYYVQYLNTSDSPNPGPGNLYSWFGNEIAAYNAGAAAAGGDFDIADVALASPPDEAVVALPATFCWTPRGVPGDNYRFTLYDMFTGETVTSGYLAAPPAIRSRRCRQAGPRMRSICGGSRSPRGAIPRPRRITTDTPMVTGW